jgi:structure-specific recognition protein 1
VPRGRYDIELFDKYMKLHGKTFDYKCLYTNVSALYLLPKQVGVRDC